MVEKCKLTITLNSPNNFEDNYAQTKQPCLVINI